MDSVFEALAPWVAMLGYIAFGYLIYIYFSNRFPDSQIIRTSVVGGVLLGFLVTLVLLYLNFRDLQSHSGLLSVF